MKRDLVELGLRVAEKGWFSSASINAASGWCFRSSLACPGAERITETDFQVRGQSEGFVSGHLQPAVSGQRALQ
jgi:hypothetical protein